MTAFSRASARLEALAKANEREIRKFSQSGQPVSEYFGCNTFSWDLMSQRLSPQEVSLLKDAPPSTNALDPELATKVAAAVQEWAVEKGATHYCHWFHPQTGATAEKHDSFFSFDKNGNAIEEFSAKSLMQQEPDASSFPSGGRRSTFEARGYTAWDATSPMFLMETTNGMTLCIPSIFISYSGESLDKKTPLLRSITAISDKARDALKLLGDKSAEYVVSTCGPEQEYFVVDSAFYSLRPDLVQAGRTVFGRVPPKGQQLDDHYFGAIKQRVLNFMMECEHELYKLGVPCKTRHNEVAPSQCEAAPIFEYANVAADHNQIVMEVIRNVASRHHLKALFHEKPYANMNGSGKHLNWSLADNRGKNLLDPGEKPEENVRFLYFLTAVIKGVHDYANLLRCSVASAGNDFRLGANEAPPAIMSVFLGETLTKVLESISTGEGSTETKPREIDLDLARIPVVARDNTDRNRTSPFAFTGNKFEFRALGSSQSISYPTTYLNAAVAIALEEMNTELRQKSSTPTEAQILEVIRSTYNNHKKVCFEGDGYSEEWHNEAEKRGLPNHKDTPAALQILKDKELQKKLVEIGIYSKADELDSRFNVLIERYNKIRLIELETMLEMVSSHVIPAANQQLRSIADTAAATKEILGAVSGSQKKSFETVSNLTDQLITFQGKLDSLIVKCHDTEDEVKLGDLLGKESMTIMAQINDTCNELELHIDDVHWSLPKYREMIYSL